MRRRCNDNQTITNKGKKCLWKLRINCKQVNPEGIQAMWGLEKYVHQCGLELPLLELVKTRASQINGCAYCIDMHTKDARVGGETEQRATNCQPGLKMNPHGGVHDPN